MSSMLLGSGLAAGVALGLYGRMRAAMRGNDECIYDMVEPLDEDEERFNNLNNNNLNNTEMLEAMKSFEMDQSELESDYVKEVLNGTGGLEGIKTMGSSQKNSMKNWNANFGTQTLFTAMTQLGKTNMVIYALWKAAVTKGMMSVILAMNSVKEPERYADDVERFNLILGKVAQTIGVPKQDVVTLKPFTCTKDLNSAIVSWHGDQTKVCPVYVTISNGAKIDSFKMESFPPSVQTPG